MEPIGQKLNTHVVICSAESFKSIDRLLQFFSLITDSFLLFHSHNMLILRTFVMIFKCINVMINV